MQKNKKPQSHGLSHDEISNLKQEQMSDNYETVTANKNGEYQIPAKEEHLVHVVIETKSFNTATGAKTSVPFVQSFYPVEFKRMEKEGAFLGKDVEVIHEPSGLKKVEVKEEDKSNLGQGAYVEENGQQIKNLIKEEGNGSSDVVVIPPKTEGEGGTGEGDKTKPSLDWSKPQLQAKYKELWAEDPANAMKKEELLEAINEKLPKTEGEGGTGE